MNMLDHTLESLSRAEPAPADVQEAQRKLEAAIASAPRRRAPRVTGWLATAASALGAVAAFIWLPLASTPTLAFSDVQKHFRNFDSLRFDFEQRMDGKLLVKGRVSMLADGSVRTEVGDDVVVVVNVAEKQVLTLLRAGHLAMLTPLEGTPTQDDSLEWLREVRDFQGSARAIPGSRTIDGQRAHGWELPIAQGKIVLWATEAGLPLEMQIDQGVKIDMSFRFDFDPKLSAESFSTKVPAGYTLRPSEDD